MASLFEISAVLSFANHAILRNSFLCPLPICVIDLKAQCSLCPWGCLDLITHELLSLPLVLQSFPKKRSSQTTPIMFQNDEGRWLLQLLENFIVWIITYILWPSW
ncbi:hypothetical protein XENOCAPTIV_025772 [Xenoophorus captivus]|uniref:Uncharacterized protein n=1 Tax=Xenoophorus captivus TaxID=1517983 RepID=A0ABV0QWK6_9TELE